MRVGAKGRGLGEGEEVDGDDGKSAGTWIEKDEEEEKQGGGVDVKVGVGDVIVLPVSANNPYSSSLGMDLWAVKEDGAERVEFWIRKRCFDFKTNPCSC